MKGIESVMKKVVRTLGSILMLSVLMLQVCFAANVSDTYNDINLQSLATIDAKTLPDSQLKRMEEQIQNLSNEEYDALLAYLVNTTSDSNKLRESLRLVGVDLSEIHRVYYTPTSEESPAIMPMTEAYQSFMSVYDSSRTGHTNKRISVSYKLNTKESHPGSYDAIVLYYDSTKATYKSYSTEKNYTSLKNGTKAAKGTLVFNFYDKIAGNNLSHATVEVARTSKSPLHYSAVWNHSYTKTNVNVTLNPSVSFGGTGGVSGSIGATIAFGSKENVWQLSDVGYYS